MINSSPNLLDFESLDSLCSSLDFSLVASSKTTIFVVAKNKNTKKNSVKKIKCGSSTPLCPLVYDIQSDCYILSCYDFIELASIPVGFQAKLKEVIGWHTNIPVPEKIFLKHLTPEQKNNLKKFFQKHSKSCEINYIQMLEKAHENFK